MKNVNCCSEQIYLLTAPAPVPHKTQAASIPTLWKKFFSRVFSPLKCCCAQSHHRRIQGGEDQVIKFLSFLQHLHIAGGSLDATHSSVCIRRHPAGVRDPQATRTASASENCSKQVSLSTRGLSLGGKPQGLNFTNGNNLMSQGHTGENTHIAILRFR